jgi:hypothetical protein
MMKLIGIVVVLVALAFLLMGINVFLFRRKFPETEIGANRHMKKLGLSCPQCEERKRTRHKRSLKPVSISPEKLRPDWKSIRK